MVKIRQYNQRGFYLKIFQISLPRYQLMSGVLYSQSKEQEKQPAFQEFMSENVFLNRVGISCWKRYSDYSSRLVQYHVYEAF